MPPEHLLKSQTSAGAEAVEGFEPVTDWHAMQAATGLSLVLRTSCLLIR
jgi:hypothetical protein